jgi:hypothetical protein
MTYNQTTAPETSTTSRSPRLQIENEHSALVARIPNLVFEPRHEILGSTAQVRAEQGSMLDPTKKGGRRKRPADDIVSVTFALQVRARRIRAFWLPEYLTGGKAKTGLEQRPNPDHLFDFRLKSRIARFPALKAGRIPATLCHFSIRLTDSRRGQAG